MPTARKVFCEFTDKGAHDFYFHNFDQVPGQNIQPINKIASESDVKLAGGRIGMYPIKIMDEDLMRSILWLALDQGFKTDGDAVIPLAYD